MSSWGVQSDENGHLSGHYMRLSDYNIRNGKTLLVNVVVPDYEEYGDIYGMGVRKNKKRKSGKKSGKKSVRKSRSKKSIKSGKKSGKKA